jgi:hypothetical protein
MYLNDSGRLIYWLSWEENGNDKGWMFHSILYHYGCSTCTHALDRWLFHKASWMFCFFALIQTISLLLIFLPLILSLTPQSPHFYSSFLTQTLSLSIQVMAISFLSFFVVLKSDSLSSAYSMLQTMANILGRNSVLGWHGPRIYRRKRKSCGGP